MLYQGGYATFTTDSSQSAWVFANLKAIEIDDGNEATNA